ncbi:MAG: hypothetical protein PHE17_20335, partial [Thiothrix sp.]|uniref:hypothetical protein n=1 Tax=Thiothrix sp. TaxID=1032 RepID=UPI00262C0EAE
AARTGDGALMQDAVPFASYDTDANGSISEAELDAFRTTRQAGWATDGAPMRGQGNSPAFDDFNQGGSGNRLGQDEAQDSVWGAQADGDGFGGRGQGGGHGGGSGQGHGGRGR